MGWKNCFSADSRRSNQSLSRKSAFWCSRGKNAFSIESLVVPPLDSLETEKFIMIIEYREEEHTKCMPWGWTTLIIENEMKIWLITQSKNSFSFRHVFNLNNEWWAGCARLIASLDFSEQSDGLCYKHPTRLSGRQLDASKNSFQSIFMRGKTAINLATRAASFERNKHPTILNFDASLNFCFFQKLLSSLNKLFNNRNLRERWILAVGLSCFFITDRSKNKLPTPTTHRPGEKLQFVMTSNDAECLKHESSCPTLVKVFSFRFFRWNRFESSTHRKFNSDSRILFSAPFQLAKAECSLWKLANFFVANEKFKWAFCFW